MSSRTLKINPKINEMPLDDLETGESAHPTQLRMPFLTQALAGGIQKIEEIMASDSSGKAQTSSQGEKRRHNFDSDAESADDGDYMTDAPPLHVKGKEVEQQREEGEVYYEADPAAYAPEEILNAAIDSTVNTITASFDKQEGKVFHACNQLITSVVEKRTELIAKAQQGLIDAVRVDIEAKLPTLSGFVSTKEYAALHDTVTKLNAEVNQLRTMLTDRRKIDQSVLDGCAEIIKRCNMSEILRAEKDALQTQINDMRRDAGLTPTEVPIRETIAGVRKAVVKDLGTLGAASSSTSVPFVPSSASSNPHGPKLATKRQNRPSGF